MYTVYTSSDQECRRQIPQQIGARAVTGVDVGGKVCHSPWTPERALRVGTYFRHVLNAAIE